MRTICYHRGCNRKVKGSPGPRYCANHAAERIAELRTEVKVLREAYGSRLDRRTVQTENAT